jgi:solute carrier family 5 (sodium-coupled monocarboxylate transporter), member 8/12
MNASSLLENPHGLFGVVDYTLFAIMLGVSTSIGIYFGCFANSSETTEEYLMGGRKMKTLPIAISLIAR